MVQCMAFALVLLAAWLMPGPTRTGATRPAIAAA
jgi:hypothetical protein